MSSLWSVLSYLFSLFVICCVVFPQQMSANSSKNSIPLIIAHRGASGYRPEHTYASYELAIEMGADYIELDICSTSDHEIVVVHDANLKWSTNVAEHPEFALRKTNKTLEEGVEEGWFIDDFTLAEVQTLRVVQRFSYRPQGYNNLYQIPTLREVIQFLQAKEVEKKRSIGLYIETKDPTFFRNANLPLEAKLVSILQETNMSMRSNLLIESFDVSALTTLHAYWPWLGLVYLCEVELTDENLTMIATYARGLGLSKALIAPPKDSPIHGMVDPTNLVKRAHNKGLLVHVWTFRDDPFYVSKSAFNSSYDEYMQFFSLGVDGFFTDFPDSALQARTKYLILRDRLIDPFILYMLLLPVALLGLLVIVWITGRVPSTWNWSKK